MSSSMGLLSTIILTASAFSRGATAYSEVNESSCDCYLTNGSTANYFAERQFFDFRSLSQYAGVPAAISDATASQDAAVTSDYFRTDNWTNAWDIQNFDNEAKVESGKSSIFMPYSPSNIYIEANNDSSEDAETFLTLRSVRFEDFQSAAEIDSVITNYQYGSIRMRARTLGSPGAIAAMFTYRAPTDTDEVQEADFEVRTQDPKNSVQYTNQPSAENGGNPKDTSSISTSNVTLPQDLSWTSWADHRLDWNPDASTWYINGEQSAQITYQTPQDGSYLIFNVWGDGGSWPGNMSVGGAAYMQIQWIELVYNVTTTNSTSESSSKARRGGAVISNVLKRADDAVCHNACSIDEVQYVGTTVLIQENWAASLFGQLKRSTVALVPVFAMGTMIMSPLLF